MSKYRRDHDCLFWEREDVLCTICHSPLPAGSHRRWVPSQSHRPKKFNLINQTVFLVRDVIWARDKHMSWWPMLELADQAFVCDWFTFSELEKRVRLHTSKFPVNGLVPCPNTLTIAVISSRYSTSGWSSCTLTR